MPSIGIECRINPTRDLLVLSDRRREEDVGRCERRAVVPAGVLSDAPGGLHLPVRRDDPELVFDGRHRFRERGLQQVLGVGDGQARVDEGLNLALPRLGRLIDPCVERFGKATDGGDNPFGSSAHLGRGSTGRWSILASRAAGRGHQASAHDEQKNPHNAGPLRVQGQVPPPGRPRGRLHVGQRVGRGGGVGLSRIYRPINRSSK
jgi:hypothetical protein